MSTSDLQANTLKQACEAVSSDGFLTPTEIWQLADWIERHPEVWRMEIGKRLGRSINAAISDGKVDPAEVANIAQIVVEIRDAHDSLFVAEQKAAPVVSKKVGFLGPVRTWLAQQRVNSQWNKDVERQAQADKQLGRQAAIARHVQALTSGQFGSCANFVPQRGESVCYVTSGRLHEVKVVKREYVGGSRSTRIRVAKGVSFSVGGSRGQLVNHEDIVETARGRLVVTTKRLVFLGDAKSLTIELPKLLSAEIALDVIKFPAPRTGKPCLVQLENADGDYVAAVMNFAVGNAIS